MNDQNQQFFQIVKRHYPNAQLQLFENGWDHLVIVVDNKFAFKFPWESEENGNLQNEARFLHEFAKVSPVRVPDMRFITDESGIVYARYDFISGAPLKKEIFQGLDQIQKEKLAKQLGVFLTALHSFPLDQAKNLGVYSEDYKHYWKRRGDYLIEITAQQLEEKEHVWVRSLFTNFLSFLDKQTIPITVTHFDLYDLHILIDQQTASLNGIIDFADMRLFDPVFDFSEIGVDYGSKFLEMVFSNYTVDLGISVKKRLQFYQAQLHIVWLEQAITRDRHLLSLRKQELNTYIQNVR